MLSHYVFEQSDCYFNTVTSVHLPKDSSEETLRENFFLQGQEEAAVHSKLFGRPVDQVGIKIIPTWRCNLRCGHCFVLHKLQKQDSVRFDVDGFLRMVDSILDTCPITRFGISFIGGEATLEADMCSAIWDGVSERLNKKGVPTFISTITTNGTNWDRPTVELLARIGTIMVSVDGNAAYHNKQRRPYSDGLKNEDLYHRTLRNIKRMVLMGWSQKITVQASLYDDGFNEEGVREFYRDLLSCGVDRPRISVGAAVPTPLNRKETNLFEKYLAQSIFNRPCCTYRYGSELVVDNTSNVYADYFKESEETVLGTFDSPFSEIIEKHKQMVKRIMPVLNDEKCQKCPVLGACWGRCSNTEFLKPSEVCDQEGLLRTCQEFARKDLLVSKYMKTGSKDDPRSKGDFYTHS